MTPVPGGVGPLTIAMLMSNTVRAAKLRRGDASLLKVGLTGGIASGKSTVGEIFVSLGAHLIQADQIAHDLMRPGEKVYGGS